MKWLVWTSVAGVLAWAAVRVSGVHLGMRSAQLLAFTPYVALASVVPATAAALTRRWVAFGAAVLATASLGGCVLPRAIADDVRTVATGGPALRVLSANLMVGTQGTRELVALVKRLDVDLLAVQELTPVAERGLDDSGLPAVLAYRVSFPKPGVEGSAVYSRHPLGDGELHRLRASGFHQARATVRVPGATPVTVESVHPCAPLTGNAHCWSADLAEQLPATVDGTVRILVGDFNATVDHVQLRRLIDTGYRDAADTVGDGLVTTWPYDGRWYLPGVTLDRVLVDPRVGVVRVSAHEVGESDHKAFFAELRLPPG